MPSHAERDIPALRHSPTSWRPHCLDQATIVCPGATTIIVQQCASETTPALVLTRIPHLVDRQGAAFQRAPIRRQRIQVFALSLVGPLAMAHLNMATPQQHHQRVFVGLQYRGALSLGEHRARLGFAAFHWSIVIALTQFHRFDVTDGLVQDDTGTDLDPNREWTYRHQADSLLAHVPRFLGAVEVGHVRSDATADTVDEILKRLPLPLKHAGPQQNCVSWARSAVQALQREGHCRDFELEPLMEFALRHADERIAGPSKPGLVSYAPKPSDQKGVNPFVRRIKFLGLLGRHSKEKG